MGRDTPSKPLVHATGIRGQPELKQPQPAHQPQPSSATKFPVLSNLLSGIRPSASTASATTTSSTLSSGHAASIGHTSLTKPSQHALPHRDPNRLGSDLAPSIQQKLAPGAQAKLGSGMAAGLQGKSKSAQHLRDGSNNMLTPLFLLTPRTAEPEVAIQLYDLLNQPKDVPWRSPLFTDEFYLLNLLYDGDELLGSQLLEHAKSKSASLLSASSPRWSSDDLHSTAAKLSHLTINEAVEEEQGGAAALGIGPLPSPNATSSHSSHVSALSPSVHNLAAPRLPKKTMQPGASDANPFKSMQKFNSCTTLFTVDSTLFQPAANPKRLTSTLKAVAHAVMSHVDRTYALFREVARMDAQRLLREQDAKGKLAAKVMRSADALSEKLHTIWSVRRIPDEVLLRPYIMQPPSVNEVYTFLKQIFVAADLCAEVGILALIYLERMLRHTHVSLQGVNIFWALLGGIMVASKVWDDQAVWNVDFKSIIPDIHLDDLNALERWWLREIKYDVNVSRALYAQYWFGIREMTERLNGVKVGQVRMSIRARSDMNVSTAEATGAEPARRASQDLHRGAASGGTVPKPLTEVHMQKMAVSSTYSQSKIRASFQDSLDGVDGVVLAEEDDRSSLPSNSTSVSSTESQTNLALPNTTSSRPSLSAAGSNGVGWGGSNLRRSKSDQLYTPSVPAASVL